MEFPKYPKHSGRKTNKSVDYVRENVEVIVSLLRLSKDSGRSKMIRAGLVYIADYWERNEGYTYGYSQGFIDNIHLINKKASHPNGKVFEFEHAVPVAIIENHLRSSNMSVDEIIMYLRKAMCIYVITKEENSALKAYRSSMPIGSSNDDVMARYNACGIKIVKHYCK